MSSERTMKASSVNYAVKALMSEMGLGHLSVHTRSALLGRSFVTTVIVGKDRYLCRLVAATMRQKWLHDVSQRNDGSVVMVSPKVWHF